MIASANDDERVKNIHALPQKQDDALVTIQNLLNHSK